MDNAVTRRRYTLALTAIGAVGLSGCSDSEDNEQQPAENNESTPQSDQSTSETDQAVSKNEFPSLSADDPAYRDWVPGTGDLAGAFDAAHNLSLIREHKSQLPAAQYEGLANWATFGGYIGMEYEEMDGFLGSLGLGAVVFMGSVTPSTVADRLEPTRYEQYNQQSDITFYRENVDEQPNLLGVGSEGIVSGGGTRGDQATVSEEFNEKATTLFDTVRGNRPRLHEESDVYREYTDRIGWPLVVDMRRPQAPSLESLQNENQSIGAGGGRTLPGKDVFADEVVADIRWGFGSYLSGSSLVDTYWLQLVEDSEMTVSELRDRYRGSEMRSQFKEEQKLAVLVEDQSLMVSVATPFENGGGGADPPVVALDVSINGSTATVEHVAGDALSLDHVSVMAEERKRPWDGTLSPGESVSVDIGSADRVTVIYEVPNGESTTVLADS
jgi:hypothetical protein